MPEFADSTRTRLRVAGLRVTGPRLAVLEWLAGHPHATADAVHTAVRERLGSVSVQAVYDVLGALERVGLVRRIENSGHPAQFETRAGDGHHHLVCRGCGYTVDVDNVVGEAPCVDPPDTSGYQVKRAEVIFWGYCRDCVASIEVP